MSEWQEEKNIFGGVTRFRMVNGVKEYEMKLETTDGMILESQLQEHNRNKREQREERIRKLNEHIFPAKYCPFNGGTSCKHNACALFMDSVCKFSMLADHGAVETIGKKCPLTPSQCRDDCALYKDGCILTEIKKG